MKKVSAAVFRQNMFRLLDETYESTDPLLVTNRRGYNFVIMAQEDYDAMNETVYLMEEPGLIEAVYDCFAGNGDGVNWRDV